MLIFTKSGGNSDCGGYFDKVLGVPHETMPNGAILNPIAQASVTFNIQMGKPRGRHAKILEKCDHVSVGLPITGWGWS